MEEKPSKAQQSVMTLTCCRCWKQFEIYGESAENTKRFYAAQPNHTSDKEVGVCDQCWAKCTANEPPDTYEIIQRTGDNVGSSSVTPPATTLFDENPYKAPQEESGTNYNRGWPAARRWFVLLAFPLFGIVMALVATSADPISMQIGLTAGLILAAIADGLFLLVLWITRSRSAPQN
jgi:hypothetical protein